MADHFREIQKARLFYEENYESIVFDFNTRQQIGNSMDRVCRFCGAKGPFEKTAHAIPKFIGNKSIISFDECDNCNNEFSLYEQHLAQCLGMGLFNSGILGRKNKKTIKTADYSLSLSNHAREIIYKDLSSVKIDYEANSVSIKNSRLSQPFIPDLAIRGFVKSICSVLNQQDLKKATNAIEWLRRRGDWTAKSFPVPIIQKLGQAFSGTSRFTLLRKISGANCPSIFGIFEIGNTSYMVVLPFHEDDTSTGQKFPSYPYYPRLTKEYCDKFGLPKPHVNDFAIKTPVSNINTLTYFFESIAVNGVPTGKELIFEEFHDAPMALVLVLMNGMVKKYDDFKVFHKDDKITISSSLYPLIISYTKTDKEIVPDGDLNLSDVNSKALIEFFSDILNAVSWHFLNDSNSHVKIDIGDRCLQQSKSSILLAKFLMQNAKKKICSIENSKA